MSVEYPHCDRLPLERYLRALYRSAPPAAWVEVRSRSGPRMRQSFHLGAAIDVVAETILARGAASDVFVGVVPRSRQRGGRPDLIAYWNVVWADCDDAESVLALERFHPAPSVLVATSEERRHAYWLLAETLTLNRIESINRRLALALGADQRCADAARILRAAGSLNRKYSPPTPVRLLRCNELDRVALGELEASLPPERLPSLTGRVSFPDNPLADPLRGVAPRMYVERLTHQQVARSGKIRCPFHEDRTPSLHVYREPDRGWYCFGCGRGGSIYDLAALLWKRETRGEEFLRLRRDLERLLSPALSPRGPAV